MTTWARALRHGYERTARELETGVQMLERRYTPLGRFSPGPFENWSFLWQPALLGLLAMVLILAGASFTNSPFKFNMTSTWFFGEPAQGFSGTPSQTKLLLSIVLVYGGLLLLMRVWLRLAEVMKLHAGAPVRDLWWILLLWATPMIVAPPLFSRDVFSYAAQGEMTSHHLNPYILGPFSLGSSPYVNPVDPLWWNAPAPYGPFFLFLDGSIAKLTFHNQLATVAVLRLLEVGGVAMIGWGITRLARALRRDPGEAFLLSALNPLVLLTLIGGAHNDAIMTGFLVIGVALAARKKLVAALVMCACATAIKAPAAYGLAFISWTWLGARASVRERLKPIAVAAGVTAATLGVWTWLAGFGFGWVRNLLSNGTVRSWAAPATAVGLIIGRTINAVGFHSISVASVLSVTRFVGFSVAALAAAWLLLHAERRGWVRSLGLALVLLVVLGPVVQPWYFAWGLVLLAASYQGREHFWLLLLSIVGPFIGLPGGSTLLKGLVHSNPLLIAVAVAILGGVLILPMGRWTQWSSPEQDPVAA
jgi:alpha-1,6-mannosyltransferase